MFFKLKTITKKIIYRTVFILSDLANNKFCVFRIC